MEANYSKKRVIISPLIMPFPDRHHTGETLSPVSLKSRIAMESMNISHEFSRFAEAYATYDDIQRQVARRLMEQLPDRPRRILDLGCGRGALYQLIDWQIEHFIGVDFAPRMLELHPKATNVECIFGDFNNPALYEHLQMIGFDRIFSASALQWSDDLAGALRLIRTLNAPVSLAIFTSGTFATLLKTAGVPPLLRSADVVEATVRTYFSAPMECVRYQIHFENTRQMLRYIKHSGVSGNRNLLTLTQTRRLMQAYPLDYLEFEVFFIHQP